MGVSGGVRLRHLVIKAGNRKLRALTLRPDLICGLEQICSPRSTSAAALPPGWEDLVPCGPRCQRAASVHGWIRTQYLLKAEGGDTGGIFKT